jgi:hypothetical protein
MTPQSGLSTHLTQVPLEIIDNAITILSTTIVKNHPPPEALLYLGIWPTPHGGYIALPWSFSEIEPKIDFPIQFMASGSLHIQGSQSILGTISSALNFIDAKYRSPWQNITRSGVFRGLVKDWSRVRFPESVKVLQSIIMY